MHSLYGGQDKNGPKKIVRSKINLHLQIENLWYACSFMIVNKPRKGAFCRA